MMLPTVNEFIVAAREFRSFAEDERDVRPADLWRVREILLRLVSHIPAVEAAPQGGDYEGLGPDDATYLKAAKRFNHFPFNLYRVVFDPHDLDANDEPVMGMLSDDLSDIYRDLAEGLDCADHGHIEEACFNWSLSYRSHWARHAMNALMAIELHRTNGFETIEQTSDPGPRDSDKIRP